MSAFPSKKYSVIYADPPWAWSKSALVDRGAARAVEKEYRTMQPDEIKALPVADLANNPCALLMWATSPKAELAFEVIRAWGFTFKTIAFVWVKENRKSPGFFTGMGFYTRQNAEFCLLATRGKRSPERLSKSVHSVVSAPVGIHSAKPDEVRRRIDRLFGGDRIELFARKRSPGWDAWGDQSPGQTDKEIEDA